MSNYPPGVSGNEPQITGEWPCDCSNSDDSGYDPRCPLCGGRGILREEVEELADVKKEIADLFAKHHLGRIEFDTGDDYLTIFTDYRVVGDLTILEDSGD